MAAGGPVTLIYTNSCDGTTDLVVSQLGPDSVFRFNFDLWRDYQVRIGPRDFELRDPTGRRLRAENVAKVYWRKPCRNRELFPERTFSSEDIYMEEELWYALGELINFLWAEGKLVLVEPNADQRVGRFMQMRQAADLFPVPAWKFVCGAADFFSPVNDSVVKSLTSMRVGDRSAIFTSRARETDLDPSAPWFIQDYVPATADVTAAYVRGDVFAFELDRSAFIERTVDWRETALDAGARPWVPHPLPAKVSASMRIFMKRLGLDYGRFDFLRRDDDYLFLEVNPNGEWGWLDIEGRHGLRERLLREVSPLTELHQLAWPCEDNNAHRK